MTQTHNQVHKLSHLFTQDKIYIERYEQVSGPHIGFCNMVIHCLPVRELEWPWEKPIQPYLYHTGYNWAGKVVDKEN